jgi:hypothetical protein
MQKQISTTTEHARKQTKKVRHDGSQRDAPAPYPANLHGAMKHVGFHVAKVALAGKDSADEHAKELAAYFDDPVVHEWLKEQEAARAANKKGQAAVAEPTAPAEAALEADPELTVRSFRDLPIDVLGARPACVRDQPCTEHSM